MCDLAFLSVIKKEKKKSSVSGKQLHVIIELACNYLYMHCMQAKRGEGGRWRKKKQGKKEEGDWRQRKDKGVGEGGDGNLMSEGE